LTRSTSGRTPSSDLVTYFEGDPTQQGTWQNEAIKHEGIINLAGESIFKRWTDQIKTRLRESRILTTRNIVDALDSASVKTSFLFNTSAVGYYGFRGDEELDESSSPGDDFLGRLCLDWEAEAHRAENFGVRVVITRFGIVLAKGGGALDQMVSMFRKFVGGPLGSGKQWFSWIHTHDLMRIFSFLLQHPETTGPVNCTSPQPVRNAELAHTLGKVLGRPSSMPTPGFMIKLIMGEFGSTLIKGQRVLPQRLLQSGFEFKFKQLHPALQDILHSK